MTRKPLRKTKPRAKPAKKAVRKSAGKHAALTPPLDATEALVAASAQALGLSLDPAWRPGVKFNLQLILRLGALVDEFPLPDEAEPAPIFHA